MNGFVLICDLVREENKNAISQLSEFMGLARPKMLFSAVEQTYGFHAVCDV